MSKYFSYLQGRTEIDLQKGSAFAPPPAFYTLAGALMSKSVFIQALMQKIIFISHGNQLAAAKQSLRKFPSPKNRLEFLCNFPYTQPDTVVATVFNYSRTLFLQLYELRNILAHDVAASCADFPGAVLFAELNEEAGLLETSGRLWHDNSTTPQNVFGGIVAYIKRLKVVEIAHLEAAHRDADTCAWALMMISQILEEDDESKREELRRSFLVFKGTSHLFTTETALPGEVSTRSFRQKTIGNSTSD